MKNTKVAYIVFSIDEYGDIDGVDIASSKTDTSVWDYAIEVKLPSKNSKGAKFVGSLDLTKL